MTRFRRFLRWTLLGLAGLVVLGVLGAGALYVAVSSRLPDVQTLRDIQLQEPMYVYAQDGRLMALFGEMRRYPVRIEEVPEQLKQAFMAIEDARFYEHEGVDYKGVARAIWLLATTSDKRVPGGSTITQQVARQFFLSSEYSYTRKFAEMLLAIKMERHLTKEEIFELYLNKSFFGNRSYGVAAAAEFYYGKTLDQLDLDEMVSLASIPKFPSSGNPISNPERARERRDYGLDRMAELGMISAAEARAAQSVAMHARPHERPIEVYAPYVAEMVRQEMEARYGGDVLTKGYRVTTTIQPQLQAGAEKALRDGLMLYDRRHGWHGVEQTHELAADEDAATVATRIRQVPAQSGMLPAVVLSAEGGRAQVVLADGQTVSLDAASTRWTNRSPGALLKRGNQIRVVRQQAEGDDGAVSWRVSQLPRAQAAIVSLDSSTGALQALVGGFSFAGNEFNRATQARRQPGSSFKPFVYAAGFERGYNPASIVLDAPVVFTDRRGRSWRPQNDGGGFSGPMRLREALVRSKNLVSVRLLDAIGVDYARRYISHFGIDEALIPPNLSMSLGTASIPPMAVARGYAAFSNGGFRIDPWFIDEVRDRDGKVVFKANPPTACKGCGIAARPAQGDSQQGGGQAGVVAGFNLGPAEAAAAPSSDDPSDTSRAAPRPSLPEGAVVAPRAIDERVAYQLVSMMRDVVNRGTGTAAKVLKREDVGGKTGSTNDYRDAWFAGFGGPYTTVVWVGRDDFSSLGRGEYGGRAALPIWIDYMRVALEDQPLADNEPPEGMVKVAVSASGQLLPGSSGGLTEWVKAEDLERMESYVDYGEQDEVYTPTEESFEIF
ncbi:MAG: penicillin-binding protein 1A [Pseudoxanthomonas suwonensis]|nr:penicillin-binding protein 1A [Pseudoxanthomonas suwonensis]